jgi:hypothetical protein
MQHRYFPGQRYSARELALLRVLSSLAFLDLRGHPSLGSRPVAEGGHYFFEAQLSMKHDEQLGLKYL